MKSCMLSGSQLVSIRNKIAQERRQRHGGRLAGKQGREISIQANMQVVNQAVSPAGRQTERQEGR